jgi:hypothetical protein
MSVFRMQSLSKNNQSLAGFTSINNQSLTKEEAAAARHPRYFTAELAVGATTITMVSSRGSAAGEHPSPRQSAEGHNVASGSNAWATAANVHRSPHSSPLPSGLTASSTAGGMADEEASPPARRARSATRRPSTSCGPPPPFPHRRRFLVHPRRTTLDWE